MKQGSRSAPSAAIERREQAAARPRRRPSDAEGMILMYHRIVDGLAGPVVAMRIPGKFRAAAGGASREMAGSHSSLRELVEPRSAVAPRRLARWSLTFDDGYADNLYQAKPLLARHQTCRRRSS